MLLPVVVPAATLTTAVPARTGRGAGWPGDRRVRREVGPVVRPVAESRLGGVQDAGGVSATSHIEKNWEPPP